MSLLLLSISAGSAPASTPSAKPVPKTQEAYIRKLNHPDIRTQRRKTPFSRKLDKQWKQVKNHAQVLRFKANRREIKKNPLLPIYHFISPENRVGDPNGLCYWQNRWHLFYQFRPDDGKWPVYWGHAVSDDLINWKDLPIALYGRQHGGKKREGSVFSGNALAEKDRVLAAYHATSEGNQVVESSDPLLLNWKKLPESTRTKGVSIPAYPALESGGKYYAAWDPFIFSMNKNYYVLSGSIDFPNNKRPPKGERRPKWYLSRSKDLKKWEYYGVMLENDKFTMKGDDGSCSYLYPFGKRDKWLLIFFSHHSKTQQMLGTLDKKTLKFTPETHSYHHAGPSSSYPDPDDNKSLVIINNNGGAPINAFTIPRKLSLADDNKTVFVEPFGSYASLRYGKKKAAGITLPGKKDLVLPGIEGSAMEMQMTVSPGNAAALDVVVFRSEANQRGAGTCIIQFRREKKLDRDGGEAWTVFTKKHRTVNRPAQFLRFNKEDLRLNIFLDRSIVEIFINKRLFLADRRMPKPGQQQVAIRSDAGNTIIKSITAWQMKSIY